jgi:DnaJ-class molecular chaperone
MAAKKTTARTTAPKKCTTCKGTGQVPVAVRGRRTGREFGKQNGFCLACFGTGHAPTD